MPSFKIAPNALAVGNVANASGAQTNTAINAAYVHRTSGAAFAIRLYARDLTSITDAYAYIASYTGTAANVTMRARVYNEDATNITRPGATLLATSSTTTLPAVSGWARFQFATPYTPTVIGEIIWIVIDNTAAAPATDFPNIRTIGAAVVYPTQNFFTGFTSTAGFSAAGTQQPRASAFIIQGGATRGLTVTGVATPLATNTRARGVIFTPPVDCTINMLEWNSPPGATMNQIRIWESTQLPNDTPVYQFTTGGTGRVSSELGGVVYMEPPFVARQGKTYYVCWTFTANSTSPTCVTTEDYATISAAIDNNMDNFTNLPLIADTGSNTWAISRDQSPRFQMLVGALDNPTFTVAY